MTLRRPRPSGPPPATVPSSVGDDAGFTLVEVLVALMIFTVVSLGVLHSVVSAATTSGDSRNRLIASNIAAGAIDQARAEGRTNLEAVDSSSWTVVVEGTTFTVERSATWVPGTGGTSCGSSGGSSLLYKRIGVAVTWPRMGTTPAVTSDTVVSPRVGTYNPDTGNLAVSVLDRDAVGVGFAQVRLVGPATLTVLSDGAGCAFFAGVTAGSYDVVVSKAHHVDHEGAAAAPAQVTALGGETVATQVNIDEAATLAVPGLDTPAGTPASVTYPVAAGAELSLGNLDLQQGRRLVPVQVGTDVTGVFPFASGYRAWLGRCSDADPEGVSSDTSMPWWPAPVGRTQVTSAVVGVTPGGRSELRPRGAQVEVRVVSAGTPLVGATVTATHAPQTGVGCNSGQTVTLGTTDATGTVRSTVPFGRAWTFRAGATDLTTTDVDPYDAYPRVLP